MTNENPQQAPFRRFQFQTARAFLQKAFETHIKELLSVSSSGVSFFRFKFTQPVFYDGKIAKDQFVLNDIPVSYRIYASSGCSTALLVKHLMTCIRASASATNERNELPRPSPFPAPLESPARSTNSIWAGVTFWVYGPRPGSRTFVRDPNDSLVSPSCLRHRA